MTSLQKSSELDRRIAAREIPAEEALRIIVAAGAPLAVARRRVAILLGQTREPLPDPATLPAGTGL